MKKLVLVLCVILSITTIVYASNLSDLKNQLNNNKDKIDDKKEELSEIKKEQANVLEDIEALSKEINLLETEIDKLDSEINTLNSNIEQKQKDLDAKVAEMEKQEDLLKQRVVAIYETGSMSMLDVLLGSENLSDFLSKYYMMSEVAEFDNDLLEKMLEQKTQIESIKATLEQNKATIEENKKSVETKSDALSVSKRQLSAKNSELETNKTALSSSIDKLVAESNKIESQIANMQGGGSYSGGQMAWPLPGYSTITSPYGMRLHPTLGVYKMHTGVDIAGSGCNGKNIVAANGGKVITATFNTAYGNMIIIDHGGGISTLYAHSSKLLVSVGQTVSRGQVIARVGTTGYSTGSHLHFEVRINGKTTNPLSYIK